MKKIKKQRYAIKSSSVEYINAIKHADAKILGLEVVHKWLVARLSSGVFLWVRNI